jgi:hypothetical protein
MLNSRRWARRGTAMAMCENASGRKMVPRARGGREPLYLRHAAVVEETPSLDVILRDDDPQTERASSEQPPSWRVQRRLG